MTNRVAKSLNPKLFKNRGACGTAVHMGVKRMVDALGDPNFTTEISILKSNVAAFTLWPQRFEKNRDFRNA